MSSLVKSFGACKLTPNVKSKDGMTGSIKVGPGGTYTTTSFFIDSSGHSTFVLPLDLKAETQEDLETILSSNSIVPPPSNLVRDRQTEGVDPPSAMESDSVAASTEESSFVGFEARSSTIDGSANAIVVEAISVLSTSVRDHVVTFETEVTVRASAFDKTPKKSLDETKHSSITTKLEVTPMLTLRKDAKTRAGSLPEVPNLLALELGAIPDHMQKESSARVHEARLEPVSLDLTLTHAFTISVKSFQSPSLGSTMVSLTIRHSNLHRELVTINNIAIHPGHSRYETLSKAEQNKHGSKYAVSEFKTCEWERII